MSTQVIPDEKREDAATGQIDSKAFSQIIEENYKIIFENTAVAITVTNNEEKLVHWNKFAEALFGMTGDDLYLKPVKELYPETEWGRIRSENIRQQGIQHHMETKVTTVDKGIIDVELSISVLRDHDQRVYGSIGVIKDISDRKKMLQSLEESMELSRGMVETAASAIFLMDEGRFTTVNRVLEEITGYSTKELMGMKREDLLFPGEKTTELPENQEAAKSNLGKTSQFRIIRKDLETVWVSEKLATIDIKDGCRILGTWTDITEWKVAEAISSEHNRQTELLLHLGATVGSTLNLSDIVENVINDLCQALSFAAVALFILKPPDQSLCLAGQKGFSDELVNRLGKVQIGRGFVGRVALTGKPIMLTPALDDPHFDLGLIQKDGLWSLYSVPIFARGQIKGIICIGSRDPQYSIERDARLIELISNPIGVAVDNAMLYEKTIEMAFTDSLTGLYNRRYLQEELEREFHRAKRNNSSFSVLSLDVDGLKSINDKYGHQHGDRLLRQVAQVIKRHTRSSDVAARVGGDEFLLLATETDTRQAADVAQRILKEINANYIEISGNKHHLHISIGLAAYPRYGSIQDIIQKADQAMYQAKAEGRNRVISAA